MNNLPKSLASHQHVVIGDAYYFPGMENELYHAIAGSSSSKIRRFKQSQQHAMHEVVEPTPAMAFGSAAHYFIVEGENAFLNITSKNGHLIFQNKFHIYPFYKFLVYYIYISTRFGRSFIWR